MKIEQNVKSKVQPFCMKTLLLILIAAAIALPAMAEDHEKRERPEKPSERREFHKEKDAAHQAERREEQEDRKRRQDLERREQESQRRFAEIKEEIETQRRIMAEEEEREKVRRKAIRKRHELHDRGGEHFRRREHADEEKQRGIHPEIRRHWAGLRERARHFGLRERELNLKERELALKEREIELKSREVKLDLRELDLRKHEIDLKAKAIEMEKKAKAMHQKMREPKAKSHTIQIETKPHTQEIEVLTLNDVVEGKMKFGTGIPAFKHDDVVVIRNYDLSAEEVKQRVKKHLEAVENSVEDAKSKASEAQKQALQKAKEALEKAKEAVIIRKARSRDDDEGIEAVNSSTKPEKGNVQQ